jgi:hypothetical protein
MVIQNPYFRPIKNLAQNIRDIQWEFPFIPQIIQLLVLLFVLVVLCILFITIGIVSQISQLFWNLIVDTQTQLQEGSALEKSAYAIAAGVYFTLFLPFWLIQSPFWFIGWIWQKLGFIGLILTFLFIGVFYIWVTHPSWITNVAEVVQSFW